MGSWGPWETAHCWRHTIIKTPTDISVNLSFLEKKKNILKEENVHNIYINKTNTNKDVLILNLSPFSCFFPHLSQLIMPCSKITDVKTRRKNLHRADLAPFQPMYMKLLRPEINTRSGARRRSRKCAFIFFLLSPSVLLKIVVERKTLVDSGGRAFSCPHSYFKKVSELTVCFFFLG